MDNAKLYEYWGEYCQKMIELCTDEAGFDLDHFILINLREHPKWQWRSVNALAKEAYTGTLNDVTIEGVKRALDRLVTKGVVVQNNMNPDQFGCKERIIRELGEHRIEKMYNPFFSAPEPCPQPIKAAIDAGLLAKPKVDYWQPTSNEPINIIDPNTFEVKQLKREDTFEVLQQCLQEVHRTVAKAEILNSQLIDLKCRVLGGAR